jgi:hypothetical protein
MALQLFFSENITYIYLVGRKRMPRGAAEIGLPFRHKRVLQIILLQRSYTTELTVVTGVLWWWFVRLWNYFSSSLSLWPLQEGTKGSERSSLCCCQKLWPWYAGCGGLYIGGSTHALVYMWVVTLCSHLQPALGSPITFKPQTTKHGI